MLFRSAHVRDPDVRPPGRRRSPLGGLPARCTHRARGVGGRVTLLVTAFEKFGPWAHNHTVDIAEALAAASEPKSVPEESGHASMVMTRPVTSLDDTEAGHRVEEIAKFD